MALSRLLLKNNRDTDQNACFCNSILQILRRMEKFKTMILTGSSENVVHKELQNIFRCEGNYAKASGGRLRKAIGSPFSHGTQQDAIEFMDTLLEKLPFANEIENLFNYELTIQRTFQGPSSPACQYCSRVEDPGLPS